MAHPRVVRRCSETPRVHGALEARQATKQGYALTHLPRGWGFHATGTLHPCDPLPRSAYGRRFQAAARSTLASADRPCASSERFCCACRSATVSEARLFALSGASGEAVGGMPCWTAHHH